MRFHFERGVQVSPEAVLENKQQRSLTIYNKTICVGTH
jgi:hypothetical protein